MIRDLDQVSLTFSLWQQARSELQALEAKLLVLKNSGRPVEQMELDVLHGELLLAKEKSERLLVGAIEALRDSRTRGTSGL
ncbi:MAG TPA: RNA polymerase subunit sigma-32 [Ramlibacter sp.]|jgi:hypothetical protein|uniref:RNA polymerase subunit sigma-32 n=1 Tax=Ramlibacter sp. TaxID=1917967 RepID=UPI002D3689D3|nr:RNA polymerase subunit sigma-32 [Ramlibacter sp.]HZY19851.1 RNA polymerase subunit sigma-32 [Ramlibacter sp.]